MAELYMRSWKTRKGESWCYWVDYYIDGKRVRESLSTQDKKAAQAEKRRIERDVEDGCHVRKRGTVTFGEAFGSYLEYLLEKGARLATLKSARSTGHVHLLPEFGRIRLVDLSTHRVQTFVNAKAKAYRWGSVKTMTRFIHATLDHAIKKKWLVRNVLRADPLELPLQRLPRNVPEPTDEQVRRLFASLSAGPPPGRQLVAFHNSVVIVALAALGLRRGEIAGLAWEDADLERGLIHIRRSQAIGEGLGPTKTPKSMRVVPLPASVRDLLWRHAQRRGGRLAGPVLRNREGEMLRVAGLSGSQWRTIMRHAGLVDAKGRALFGLQALRRWCSSHLQQSGVELADVASHLGHARASTTERFYTYRLSDLLQNAPAIERLAEAMNLPGVAAALPPAPVPPPAAAPAEPVVVALPPPRPSVYDLREEAARLRDLGGTYAEIGRRLSISPATVRRWEQERAVGTREEMDQVARRERVLALYREGLAGDVVAARVGVSVRTVYHWLRAAGVPVRPEPWGRPASVREAALRLYAAGVPVEAIVERLGICRSTLRNWRGRAGVAARPR